MTPCCWENGWHVRNWCRSTHSSVRGISGDKIFLLRQATQSYKVISDIKTMENHGICLLQAEVLSTDQAYVIERVSRLRPDYACSEHCTDEVRGEVIRSFWTSRVPLRDYLNGNTSYIMPEIILYNPIPVQRLRLIDTFKKSDLINHVRFLAGYKLYSPETKVEEDLAPEELVPQEPLKASSKVTYLTLIK